MREAGKGKWFIRAMFTWPYTTLMIIGGKDNLLSLARKLWPTNPV